MNLYAKNRIFLIIAFCGLLVACASVPEPLGLREGTWTLYAKDGAEVYVEVTELRPWEYHFDAHTHPISGVYVLDGDRVYMAKPDNPRMKEFAWRYRNSSSLLLISEPAVELSGMRLIASELIGPS